MNEALSKAVNESLGFSKPKEEETKAVTEEAVSQEQAPQTEQTPETKEAQQESVQTDESSLNSKPNSSTETGYDWKAEAEKNGYVPKDSYVPEDPFIAKMIEFRKNNVNIEDPKFWATVQKDYTAYDLNDAEQALNIVKEGLRLSEPDITDKEINAELSEFKVLGERPPLREDFEDSEDPERAYNKAMKSYNDRMEVAEGKLIRQAREHQKNLLEHQKSLQLPSVQSKEQEQLLAQQQEQAQRAFESATSKFLEDFSKVSVKIGDWDFELEVPNEEKTVIKEGILKSDQFFNRYITGDKDNPIDYSSLSEDISWANKEIRNRRLEAIINQAKSVGGEEKIVGLKNQKAPTIENPQAKKASSLLDQIGEQLISKGVKF